MAELVSPQKIATSKPFRKLNSATALRFSSSGSSLAFDIPAMPTNTMPATDTNAAATEIRPAEVVNIVGDGFPALEHGRDEGAGRRSEAQPHGQPQAPRPGSGSSGRKSARRSPTRRRTPGNRRFRPEARACSTASTLGEVDSARIHGTSTSPKTAYTIQ